MALSKTQPAVKESLDQNTLQSDLNEVKSCLEAKQEQLNVEIRQYPPPIPACDQQFNYLLEQRTRLSQALNDADQFVGEDDFSKNSVERLKVFISQLPDLDETLKQALQQKLDAESE